MKTTALTSPVTKTDIQLFKSVTLPKDRRFRVQIFLDKYGQVCVVGLVMLLWGGFAAVQVEALGTLMVTLTIGTLIIFIAAFIDSFKKEQNRLVEAVRLQMFAKENGWTYEYSPIMAAEQGTLFTVGDNYRQLGRLRTQSYEVGDVEYETGSGRSRRTQKFSYISIPLERAVPHMLLDAKLNNMSLFGVSISNLPVSFRKDQIVSLEGDFDRHFTLYAPEEYQADARYVFTPDLMQLLIDKGNAYDAEIIDRTLYIYIGSMRWSDADFWQRIEKIANTIGRKMQDRTDRYVDERVLATSDGDVVAPQGRRLKTGVRWAVLIFMVFYMVFYLLVHLRNQ